MINKASLNQKRILIVAGESSGDLHGSNLIQAACRKYPDLSFYGVGGRKMEQAGCELLFSSDELAVMGIFEVVWQLPKIIRRFRQIKQILTGNKPPDALVLIDFPDFNLRLAKVAKAANVPVLYYITPKVWAWRKKRAKTIAENTDRLAVIFPFEPEIFAPFGGDAVYVGNPLLDEFSQCQQDNYDIRGTLDIAEDTDVIGIFPGSRNSEVKYIFGTLLETANLIHKERPKSQFLLPVAPSLDKAFFVEQVRASGLPIHIPDTNIYNVASACNAVLCVSGTVTLQVTLVGTPMTILYKVAPLSYMIGKRLIKIPFAGLTNIVAGRGIVKEFIQHDANPVALKEEIDRLLDDRSYSELMINDLHKVKKLLGNPGCSEKVANLIYSLVVG